jgi:glutathione peroxidase-family protein
MTDKINVNGPDAHDVFKYLRGNTKEMVNKDNLNAVE